MRALLTYQLARIVRRKDLWGILILVVAAQLLLETQETPALYGLPPNALLFRFLPSGASQEDAFRICLTGSQMSIGAVFLLLGAAIGGIILCPALLSHAMLPITAAGYRPRQQSRCCMLLCLPCHSGSIGRRVFDAKFYAGANGTNAASVISRIGALSSALLSGLCGIGTAAVPPVLAL